MDGKLKVNLNEWITATWNLQKRDISFVDSLHIDELLQNSVRKNWIDDSISILEILNEKVKEVTCSKMVIVLSFTLNRSKEKNKIIKRINFSDFNKTETPPELYLVNTNNHNFFNYIQEKAELIEIENIHIKKNKIYYMEKWDHGFDRYLWIYFKESLNCRTKISKD